jgi:hypothetical protein
MTTAGKEFVDPSSRLTFSTDWPTTIPTNEVLLLLSSLELLRVRTMGTPTLKGEGPFFADAWFRGPRLLLLLLLLLLYSRSTRTRSRASPAAAPRVAEPIWLASNRTESRSLRRCEAVAAVMHSAASAAI